MKGYKGTFIKKTGERRTMRFVKLTDLPQDFVSSKVKGSRRNILAEGTELVWDVDSNEFRTFNFNMVVDNIEEFEYTLP